MAIISIDNASKVEILNQISGSSFNQARLHYTNNSTSYGNIVSVVWTTPAQPTDPLFNTNSAALVFNIDAGVTVNAIRIFGSSSNAITIGLDGGPFTFTTAGTFTIPIGDLTIEVA